MTRALALVFVGLLAASCGSQEASSPAPVARESGAPVEPEPEHEPEGDASEAAAAPTTARGEDDRAIALRLAAQEGARRGLAPGAKTDARSLKEEERLRDALFASLRDSLVLGEDELRAHYEKTSLRYTARQLVLRREAFASEADARAEDARLGAAGRIAAEGAETIGPAPVDRLPASVLPEALSFSAPGERAAVMRDGRWSLVELAEIRAAEPLAFELVRPQVEQSLRLIRAQAEFHAELERLRREAESENPVLR